MIKSPQNLSTINPTEGLMQYVQAVKPYHTKILDLMVEYVYTEAIVATVQDRWSWNDELSNTQSALLTSASIGERIMFDIQLNLSDSIATTVTDIRPIGYGMDVFSTTTDGSFSSAPNSATIFASGLGGQNQAGGFDLQLFDGTM